MLKVYILRMRIVALLSEHINGHANRCTNDHANDHANGPTNDHVNDYAK